MTVKRTTKAKETDPYLVLVGRAFQQLRAGRKPHELLKPGLTLRAIEKIEKGEVDTQMRSYLRLAAMLGTTLDDIHRLARSFDTRPTAEQMAAQAHQQDRALLEAARFYAERLHAVLAILLQKPAGG